MPKSGNVLVLDERELVEAVERLTDNTIVARAKQDAFPRTMVRVRRVTESECEVTDEDPSTKITTDLIADMEEAADAEASLFVETPRLNDLRRELRDLHRDNAGLVGRLFQQVDTPHFGGLTAGDVTAFQDAMVAGKPPAERVGLEPDSLGAGGVSPDRTPDRR